MSLPHFALLLLYCVVAGFNAVVAKLTVTEIPPIFFVTLRYALLALVLLPFLKWRGWDHFRRIVPAALFTGGLTLAIAFTGIKYSNASVAAIVFQLEMPFAVLLSIVWLKEQVGWRRWLGVGLTFAGMMVLGFDPIVMNYAFGVGLLVAAAACSAVGQILLRRLRDVEPLEMQAWTGAASLPLMIVGTLLFEQSQFQSALNAPWILLAGLVYMVFAMSILGHGVRFYILQRYNVAIVMTVSAFAPTLGVIFGVAILKEPLTWQIVGGCVLVLLGVLIITRRQALKLRENEVAETGSAPPLRS